jgi:CheY-like chemotaxis protein
VPHVLLLEDNAVQRTALAAYVRAAGYPCATAATPEGGVAMLEQNRAIAVVLTDLRMPAPADGIGFIQTVYRRWPALPVVVVTAYPEDLQSLQGRPEHPVLMLTKPVIEAQIQLVLRYTLARQAAREHHLEPLARVASST